MVIEKIVLSESQPESQFVLWVRPVKEGYAAYVYGKRGWHPLKDIADNGTVTTDDDELIDLSDVMKDLAEYKGLVNTQMGNMSSDLNKKVDKVDGKGLSTNDYTNEDRAKLASITEGAGGNVQADWNATDGEAEILNKPTTLSGYGITDAKIEDGTVILGEDSIKPLTEHQDISQLALKTEIPTKTSQLSNDSSYQTGDDVQAAINSAIGGITGFDTEVVDALPETGKKGVIYLIAHEHEDENDTHDEYLWIESTGKFEKVGNTDIDLTGYAKSEDVYTKKEIDGKNYLTEHQDISGKQDKLTAGSNITISNNTISATVPTDNKTLTNGAGYMTKDEVQKLIDSSMSDTSKLMSEFLVRVIETVQYKPSGTTAFTAWAGRTVHVKVGNNDTVDYTTDKNGQVSFNVLINQKYTVSMDAPSSLTDYGTTDGLYSHEYTATSEYSSTEAHFWQYGVAHVTETLTTEDEENVKSPWSGATVKITFNNKATTLTTDSNGQASYTVPLCAQYTVTPEDSDTYILNGDASKTYTASSVAESTDAHSWNYSTIPEGHISSYILHNSTSISDPAKKVTSNASASDADHDMFQWIKANTHHYVTQYDSTSDTLKCAQLSDADRTKYADDTDAPITTVGNNVFGKLPHFWFKVKNMDNDEIKILIAKDNTYIDSTWQEWDDNRFLGTYKGYVENSKLYSVSGKTPTGSVTANNFKAYAKSDSKHFSLITWEWHCMMQLLFWGMYKNTNSKAILGSGLSATGTTTGNTNSLAMTDSSNGGGTLVNFLGFEAIHNDMWEWIDRAVYNTGTLTLSDEDGNTTRTVAMSTLDYNNIRKVNITEYGDIVPINTVSNSSYNTFYSAYGYVHSGSGLVPLRSNSGSHANGGLSYLSVSDGGGHSYSDIGSRLAYQGNYELVDKL